MKNRRTNKTALFFLKCDIKFNPHFYFKENKVNMREFIEFIYVLRYILHISLF